ncbi:maleylpyruvate isomerase N-terminal domain-containing protein [Nocardia sp. NPDC059246]|uniref:maleylpyruvate isomerase N-terminal domain-containing protein n=1 Tax=unclassified Nocardia TaxID=2637762 RepID=UPI0036C026EB
MSQKHFPDKTVRQEALRTARADLITYCRSLDAEHWLMPSKAEGWLVRDVVAHLGACCRVIFTPASVSMITTNDIEHWNEKGVEQRRDWPTWQVLDEFETWSRRAITLGKVLSATPLGHARMPVGELGWFAVGALMACGPVFDQHTHLHHDIAPVVGIPAPQAGAAQMEVTVAWMIAVLANQLRSAPMVWVDAPVNLELTGPGGGAWHIGSGGLLGYGSSWSHAATISASAESFVSWATKRTAWRDNDITLEGSSDLAQRILDGINVV